MGAEEIKRLGSHSYIPLEKKLSDEDQRCQNAVNGCLASAVIELVKPLSGRASPPSSELEESFESIESAVFGSPLENILTEGGFSPRAAEVLEMILPKIASIEQDEQGVHTLKLAQGTHQTAKYSKMFKTLIQVSITENPLIAPPKKGSFSLMNDALKITTSIPKIKNLKNGVLRNIREEGSELIFTFLTPEGPTDKGAHIELIAEHSSKVKWKV